MYFSRISLHPNVRAQQLAQMICHDTYKEHQALWTLFADDPEAKRDFLYRQTQENGRLKYYVVSERQPMDRSGIWLVDGCQLYAPTLVSRQTLFFNLRANPVVTVKTPSDKKERHDVVMREKKRIDYKKLPKDTRPLEQEIVQQTCIPWLEQRAEALGFELNSKSLLVDGYQAHESYAKGKGQKPISYSTVDFQGVLTVTDPELFQRTLFQGIGKAKAFGCGLLLIKRV
jgi:CRISPR system Cascade subunit CasE